MASLKEIRARITSVASTQKITSAMKMVSAAKLKKTEGITTRFLPYKNKLSEALSNYLGSLEGEVSIPLAEKREVKKVALMAFSSSSGLCGVYNSSVSKLFKQVYEEYTESIGAENVTVFLVGKKINDYAKKFGIKVEKTYAPLAESMSYELAMEILEGRSRKRWPKLRLPRGARQGDLCQPTDSQGGAHQLLLHHARHLDCRARRPHDGHAHRQRQR